jgi:hypothetical protein
LGCWLSAGTALASPTEDETIQQTQSGQTITLIIPKGYCYIDPNTDIGKPYYEYQHKVKGGFNAVGPIFFDCQEWKHRQQDKTAQIPHSGNYGFPLMPKLPSTVDRKQFIAMAVSTYQDIDAQLKASASRFNKNMSARMQNPNPSKMFVERYITVESDENAAYAVSESTRQVEPHHVAQVLFSTIVKERLPVQMILRGVADNQASYADMLATAKRIASALVTANEK